jgi:hypothetical protein
MQFTEIEQLIVGAIFVFLLLAHGVRIVRIVVLDLAPRDARRDRPEPVEKVATTSGLAEAQNRSREPGP